MIPKIIHQTIADKSDIHPVLLENINRLKEMNPDWEYRLYDNVDCREFIRSNFDAGVLQLYDRISARYGAARADFFRYLLLYRLGGVYLDIKSTVVHPLSSILKTDTSFLISFWDNKPGGRDEGAGKHPRYGVDNEFQQWFIVSEAEHPFLKAVIDRVSENIVRYDALRGSVGASGVLRTTGPIAYTLAIQPLLHKYPHEVVDIHELGFRYSCFKNDLGRDRHRKVIPSYRDIRFPVIEVGPGDSLRVRWWYWVAVFIAYLHELSKVGGVRKTLVDLKKRRRELR